jgi:hypothetical protein
MALNFGKGLFVKDDAVAFAKNKIHHLVIPGIAFVGEEPDVDDISYINDRFNVTTATVDARAPVYLPDGATVENAIVHGTATTKQWRLKRKSLNGGSSQIMAQNNVGSSDSGIDFPVIDTQTYMYLFDVNDLDTNGLRIYDAQIKYSVPVDFDDRKIF